MARTGGPEGELVLPVATPGPPPGNPLSPEFQTWRRNAISAKRQNAVTGALKGLHRSLDPYRDLRIRTGDGQYIHVLALHGAGGPVEFGLPFALVQGSEVGKLKVSPGVLSGPSVTAGVDPAGEFFPTIGGTTTHIYEDGASQITVPTSGAWGKVYIELIFDPTVLEADGEYYVDGLELVSAEVKTGSNLPGDASAASCDPVTGEPTQGKAYKTLALIRRQGSNAPVEVRQVSYGNWYLQTCDDGNIVIYEPNYVAQTVNLAQA